jgi:hypothetical protein
MPSMTFDREYTENTEETAEGTDYRTGSIPLAGCGKTRKMSLRVYPRAAGATACPRDLRGKGAKPRPHPGYCCCHKVSAGAGQSGFRVRKIRLLRRFAPPASPGESLPSRSGGRGGARNDKVRLFPQPVSYSVRSDLSVISVYSRLFNSSDGAAK